MTDNRQRPIGSQRMPSLPTEQWTDEVRELFAVYEGEDGRENGSKYNFTHWFANHPALATQWMQYNFVLSRGVLDPRLREIVVLRVSHRYACEYEWHLHVQISQPLGIGSDELDAVKTGPDAPLWNDLERLCLRATDALCDKHNLDDELWNALAGRLNPKELVELLFLIGSYTLLAWVLNTVRVPVEDFLGWVK